MTPELVGTLSVGVALVGVFLTVAAWIRSDIRDLRIAVERVGSSGIRVSISALKWSTVGFDRSRH